MLPEDLIPAEVCHYTKRDIALNKILQDRRIRLSQIGFTNDPKENKSWNVIPLVGFTQNSRIGELDGEEVIKIQREADRIRIEEWKVLCLTSHDNPSMISTEQGPEYDHAHYGFGHPRMWAQYAENHSGVCLLFDGKKLDANIQQELSGYCKIYRGFITYDYPQPVRSYPLSYSEIEKRDLTEGIRNCFFRYYEEIFLFKSPDWETEHEYRWLVHSPNNLPEFVSIEGAIKGVMVGEGFPSDLKPILIEICKKLKIPAGIMKWYNGRPFAHRKNIYEPD